MDIFVLHPALVPFCALQIGINMGRTCVLSICNRNGNPRQAIFHDGNGRNISNVFRIIMIIIIVITIIQIFRMFLYAKPGCQYGSEHQNEGEDTKEPREHEDARTRTAPIDSWNCLRQGQPRGIRAFAGAHVRYPSAPIASLFARIFAIPRASGPHRIQGC